MDVCRRGEQNVPVNLDAIGRHLVSDGTARSPQFDELMQIGTGVMTRRVALVYPTQPRRARGCVGEDSLTCAISNDWSWALTLVQANDTGAQSVLMGRTQYAYNPLAVSWAVFHSIGLPHIDGVHIPRPKPTSTILACLWLGL